MNVMAAPSLAFWYHPKGCDPPGRCISLAAGQELELQMCYSLAAREGSLADVDRWTGGQVDRWTGGQVYGVCVKN